jgi:DNA-binding transcriptional regulator YdaS (Cro superfamily)
MTKEQMIRLAIVYAKQSQAAIAKAIGMTPSNFNQKIKRDTFSTEELNRIAKAVGAASYCYFFEFPDMVRIGNFNQSSMIHLVIAYAKQSQAAIAKTIGMTPSNFNQKIKRDTFSTEEFNRIAKTVGASYCYFFEFPDKVKIGTISKFYAKKEKKKETNGLVAITG